MTVSIPSWIPGRNLRPRRKIGPRDSDVRRHLGDGSGDRGGPFADIGAVSLGRFHKFSADMALVGWRVVTCVPCAACVTQLVPHRKFQARTIHSFWQVKKKGGAFGWIIHYMQIAFPMAGESLLESFGRCHTNCPCAISAVQNGVPSSAAGVWHCVSRFCGPFLKLGARGYWVCICRDKSLQPSG